MEELNEALKGNENKNSRELCMSHDQSSIDLSVDSLDCPKPSTKRGKSRAVHSNRANSFSLENLQTTQSVDANAANNFCLTEGVSTASVNSEPPLKSKNKVGFVKNAMDQYLSSHRHSLSSVMELIGISNLEQSSIEAQLDNVLENQNGNELVYYSDEELKEYQAENNERRYSQDATNACFFTLSPIEENSEPSTGSSTLKDNNFKDSRILQSYSSSCDPIPSEPFYLHTSEKFQTFPRTKCTNKSQINSKDYYYESIMYPLEPRELDPCAFNQLHTVDSQEELQEFLLLESECMSGEQDFGIASAFIESEEEDDPSDEYKLNNAGNNYSDR